MTQSSSANLKVLCISFHRPPEVRPQAIILGKMIPEWIRQGVRPVIVSEAEGGWNVDAKIFHISPFPLHPYLRKIPILSNMLECRHYGKSVRVCQKIIDQENINLIFSFSNPQASNILGAMLKRKTGIRYIAHFSDPWYDSPFRNLTGRQARNILKKEKFIIENCDRVVFMGEEMKDLVMKKYSPALQTKAEVVVHSYQPEDYPDVEKNAGGKIVFSHLGVIHKQRTPETFFKALNRLFAKRKELREKIAFNMIGAINNYSNYSEAELKNLIDKYDLSDVATILPAVSYRESLRCMKLADCLVAIDAKLSNTPWIISKVIDYAGSGTPIIGITQGRNPTAQFLLRLGYAAFDYEEEEKLADYLENFKSFKMLVKKTRQNPPLPG